MISEKETGEHWKQRRRNWYDLFMPSSEPQAGHKPLSSRHTGLESRDRLQTGLVKQTEYRNAHGEKICDVRIRLSEIVEDLGMKRKGRKVLEYKLRAVDAGDAGEIDLLTAARSKELGVSMYAVEGTESVNAYSPERKRVLVTFAGSLLDVVTTLHEFGHAEQEQDPRFSDISRRTNVDNKRRRGEYVTFDDVKRIRDGIDVVLSKKECDAIQEYGRLEGEANVLQQEVKRIEAVKKADIEADDELDFTVTLEKMKKVDAVLEALRARIARTVEIRKELTETLKEMLRLPKIITERDATARAFRKMRRIRAEKHIDLFASVVLPDMEKGENYASWKRFARSENDCSSFIREAVPNTTTEEASDAKTFFTQYALWSYYGRTAETMNRFGAIPKPIEAIEPDADDDEAAQPTA